MKELKVGAKRGMGWDFVFDKVALGWKGWDERSLLGDNPREHSGKRKSKGPEEKTKPLVPKGQTLAGPMWFEGEDGRVQGWGEKVDHGEPRRHSKLWFASCCCL